MRNCFYFVLCTNLGTICPRSIFITNLFDRSRYANQTIDSTNTIQTTKCPFISLTMQQCYNLDFI